MSDTALIADGLSAAIRDIERVSTKSVVASERQVTVKTKECEALLGVVSDGDGGTRLIGLTDELRAAHEFSESVRLKQAPGPDKRQGTATLQSIASFMAHATRFADPGSAVWADSKNRRLVSVLDYNAAGTAPPRWGKHRGVYECPLSEGWLAWGGGKELKLDQDDFAALLDKRDRELVGGKLPSGKTAPDPAHLVTLATNLEVYANATAKRERDPNTGRVKISYSEDKGVSGDILPPPAFLILTPVFEDGAEQPLEVRLRVTVEDGRAVFTVQIHAATSVLRVAFQALCQQVVDDTGLPVFTGTPE